MPHKEIDVAIEAFNRLHRPLLIVGDGPEARRLRRQAGPTITFAGRLSDAGVAQMLQSARALVQTRSRSSGSPPSSARPPGAR